MAHLKKELKNSELSSCRNHNSDKFFTTAAENLQISVGNVMLTFHKIFLHLSVFGRNFLEPFAEGSVGLSVLKKYHC